MNTLVRRAVDLLQRAVDLYEVSDHLPRNI